MSRHVENNYQNLLKYDLLEVNKGMNRIYREQLGD